MASTVPSASTLPASSTTSAYLDIMNSTDSTSDNRSRKRRIEEVISSVDQALAPTVEAETAPRPSKRFHTSRSLYSTLAKYGIMGKEPKATNSISTRSDSLSKAPHLSAILARTASRAGQAMSFKAPPFTQTTATSPSTKDFSPSSVASFLTRLATFKLATYANKPSQIDAVAAARCGWVNEGKDRLVCHICNASWVVAGREGMNRDAATALVEKQQQNLITAHKNLCPWKTRQCDASIYRIPLKSPSAIAKELKARSLDLDPVLQSIKIQHPLTSSQIHALTSTLSSVDVSGGGASDLSGVVAEIASSVSRASSPAPIPSETAIIASLFGWTIAPPNPPAERPSPQQSQTPKPGTPSISRSPSVSSITSSRASTPVPSSSISRRIDFSGLRRISLSKQPNNKLGVPMVHCALCQRKIGLWTFVTHSAVDSAPPSGLPVTTVPSSSNVTPPVAVEPVTTSYPAEETAQPTPSLSTTPRNGTTQAATHPARAFDVLKEHRAYCPYVVRSTSVPSLPVPRPPGAHERTASTPAEVEGEAMEGWRAVLSVMSRYRLAQRQIELARGASMSSRLARRGVDGTPAPNKTTPSTGPEDDIEIDHVGAMVDRVKARGGRELLKYVKSLLG